jgi:hypothetical protein
MKSTLKISDGAVERGNTLRPHKDLAEGAGETASLIRNGYFKRFPHLAEAFTGLALATLGSLAMMAGASLLAAAPRCAIPPGHGRYIELTADMCRTQPRLRAWSESHYPAAQLEHRPGPGFAWHRVRWTR